MVPVMRLIKNFSSLKMLCLPLHAEATAVQVSTLHFVP